MSRERGRLDALFDPRSIAVVGASADAAKWGGDLARPPRPRRERRRPLYFVNAKGGAMHGREAYRSLLDLPETPDLVVLAIPAQGFEKALDEALRRGARALVAVFAGLGETGDEGKARERAAVERVRAAGAVHDRPQLHGPGRHLHGSPGGRLSRHPPGRHRLRLAERGHRRGARHPGARVRRRLFALRDARQPGRRRGPRGAARLTSITSRPGWSAVYVEDLRDGREFARAARRSSPRAARSCCSRPGRSEASVRTARTHTGSLAPDAAVLEALCRAAAVVRVYDPGSAVRDPALSERRPAAGRPRSPSCPTAAATAVSPPTPPWPPVSRSAHSANRTLARVREALPESDGCNPINFALGTINPDAYGKVVEALAAAPDVDAVLTTGQFGYWGHASPTSPSASRWRPRAPRTWLPQPAAQACPSSPARPIPRPRPRSLLRHEGVPVYREIEAAVGALARLVEAAEGATRLRDEAARNHNPIPALPSLPSAGRPSLPPTTRLHAARWPRPG